MVLPARSPYAAAKLYAYWMVRHYREGYGLFACNGVMFNHESPRRREAFVSRKITRTVSAILTKRLALPQSLYTILQVFSVTLFKRMPLIQTVTITPDSAAEDEGCNQLSLFDR